MGFFDDVTSIVINNKEVQSIITSDDGIIYEKPSGYNLTLTADKSIIQTNELCTLSATLTNNNVPMANQTIVFNGLEYTETLEANTEITVGDTYRFTSIPSLSSSDRIYLNEEQTIYITSDIMGNKKLVINGEAPYGQQYLDLFYVENGIIYYQRTNDLLRHYDASSTNTNKITSTVSNVIIEEYAKAVTDANGVASVGYYGKGTGDLSIQADWEGRIQSEIYSIEDCYIWHSPNIHKNGTRVMLKLFNESFPNITNWEVSCTLMTYRSYLSLSPETEGTWSNYNYIGMGADGTSPIKRLCAWINSNETGIWYTNGGYGDEYHDIKIVRNGNLYSYYYDNTLLTTYTSTTTSTLTTDPLYLYMRCENSAGAEIKNIKVKPL